MVRALPLVALLLVAQGAGSSRYLPGTAPDDFAVVQVLDAETGEPIAGAKVARWSESLTGAELLGEAETDEFGLAALGPVGGDAHWVADAPGRAVLEEYGERPPEILWLDPGREFEARLFDPFGEPAAGVQVGIHLGCGHSPTVRTATTDAEGRFRMEGVTPGRGELWFEMPGAASDYEYAGPGEIHPLPGSTIRGVVLDPDGKPAAGLVVESLQLHRGPRTRTGSDGAFVLPGIAPREGLRIYFGEREVFLPRENELSPPGRPDVPLRIWLPPADTYYEEGIEARFGPYLERPVLAPGLSEDDGPGFTHLDTGLTFFAEPGEDGGFVLRGPAGAYAVLPGPAFSSRRVSGPERIVLEAGESAPVTLETTPRPELELTVRRALPEYASVHLVVPRASLPLDLAERERVHLPAEVRASIRVEWEGNVRYYPVGPVEDGRRRATIDWPEGLEPVEREGGGGFVSLAAERPADGPVLLLLDAEGRPLAGRTVHITRRNARVWGPTREDGSFPSLADGVVPAGGGGSMSSGPKSAAFLLEVEGFLPRAVPGAERPPIAIRFPAGRLRIEVAGEGGAPLDFTACVDGRIVTGTGGRLQLRGLPAGEHRVVAGALGHTSLRREFTTADGEDRLVRFELPARE